MHSDSNETTQPLEKDRPAGRYQEIDLGDVIGEADAFAAYGYCYLKVQRGDTVRRVRVRVVSIPQDELDRLRAKAPKPPSKTQIDPQTRQRVLMPDLADPDYVEKSTGYQQRFVREVVGRGIDEKIMFPDGHMAQTPEEKWKALEARGITNTQFLEIGNTILQLTEWTEDERTRFL